jgi:hypothetical protein
MIRNIASASEGKRKGYLFFYSIRILLLITMLPWMAGCAKRGTLIRTDTIQDESKIAYKKPEIKLSSEPDHSNPALGLTVEDIPYHPTKKKFTYTELRNKRAEHRLYWYLGLTGVGAGLMVYGVQPDTRALWASIPGVFAMLIGSLLVGAETITLAFGLDKQNWKPSGEMSELKSIKPSPARTKRYPISNTTVLIKNSQNEETHVDTTDALGIVRVNIARDLGLYEVPYSQLKVSAKTIHPGRKKGTIEGSFNLEPSSWLYPYASVGAKGAQVYPEISGALNPTRHVSSGEKLRLKSHFINRGAGGSYYMLAHGGFISRDEVTPVFYSPGAYASRMKVESPSSLVFRSPRFEEEVPLFPNGVLDAGESGVVILECANEGVGIGFDIVASLSSKMSGIRLGETTVSLGNIPPDSSVELRVPIKADLSIPSRSSCDIMVSALSSRGDAPQPMVVEVPIRQYNPPALSIRDRIEIVDNGAGTVAAIRPDGLIDPGETVDLRFRVANTGGGEALDVVVSVEPGQGVEAVRNEASLGSILPGQIASGSVRLYFPTSTSGKSVPCQLSIRESRTDQFTGHLYRAEVSDLSPLTSIQHSFGGGAQSVETGETFELTLTVANKGQLPIQGSSIVVEPQGVELLEGMSFRPGDITGRINPGSSTTHRIRGSVPRQVTGDAALLSVVVSQENYPDERHQIKLPIHRTTPDLEVFVEFEGGGDELERGTKKTAILRVRNRGEQTATGVMVSAAVLSGLIEADPISFSIGDLASGALSEPQRVEISAKATQPLGRQQVNFSANQDLFGGASTVLPMDIVTRKPIIAKPKRDDEEGPVPVPPPVYDPQSVPLISVNSHRDGQIITGEGTKFRTVIHSSGGLSHAVIKVNGKSVYNSQRDPKVPVNSRLVEIETVLPLDAGNNTVEVVAEDLQHRSKSSTLILTRVTGGQRKFEPQPSVDVDIVPSSRNRNADAVAVVIGVENYENVADVPFAGQDAMLFAEYANRVLGVPDENVILLLNEDATLSRLNRLFASTLPGRVASGRSDVFVYFAGHGVPDVSEETKAPYLVPQDGYIDAISGTCYSMERLYRELAGIDARSVVMVLDACFSGGTRNILASGAGVEMLFKGDRPLVVYPAQNVPPVDENILVFCAADQGQISTYYPEMRHGLFTYFFLKGLKGEADYNTDDKVAVSELDRYIRENVTSVAKTKGRVQKPVVLPPVTGEDQLGRRILAEY